MPEVKEGLVSGHYSDMTIRCAVDGSEFKVHRVVIAHSPVFKAMCNSGMKESTDKLIEDQHARGRVMACLLEYLYTGQLILNKPVLPFNEDSPVYLSSFDDIGTNKTQPDDNRIRHLAVYRDLRLAADFYMLPTLVELVVQRLSTVILHDLRAIYSPPEDVIYWKILADLSAMGAHPVLSETLAKAIHSYSDAMKKDEFVPYVKQILSRQDGEIAYAFSQLQWLDVSTLQREAKAAKQTAQHQKRLDQQAIDKLRKDYKHLYTQILSPR